MKGNMIIIITKYVIKSKNLLHLRSETKYAIVWFHPPGIEKLSIFLYKGMKNRWRILHFYESFIDQIKFPLIYFLHYSPNQRGVLHYVAIEFLALKDTHSTYMINTLSCIYCKISMFFSQSELRLVYSMATSNADLGVLD